MVFSPFVILYPKVPSVTRQWQLRCYLVRHIGFQQSKTLENLSPGYFFWLLFSQSLPKSRTSLPS